MADAADDTENRFETLLEAMPRIAEAVKVLPTPELQAKAFDALVAAHGSGGSPLTAKPARTTTAAKPAALRRRASRRTNTSDDDVQPGRRVASGPPKRVKGLDLHPSGKQAFAAFVDESSPRIRTRRTQSRCTTSRKSPRSNP